MKLKYFWLTTIFIVISACKINNDLEIIKDKSLNTKKIKLNTGSVDFSNYIAIGASFTAGYTDGALFKKAQENSFPNIISKKFALANKNIHFGIPFMNDNIGGLIKADGEVVSKPRLYFDGKRPAFLKAKPTTIIGKMVSNSSKLNNYGIPGAKSYHFITPGYGNLSGLLANPQTANPYFVRMNPKQPSIIEEVVSKKPTFFTLSEFGGNDILDYALSGGKNKITSTDIFNNAFDSVIKALTSNPKTKGVIVNIPFITLLPHFTTVPFNPLDPTSNSDSGKALAAQISLLNNVYGALNQIFKSPKVNQPNRVITFSSNKTNPVIIKDESLDDLSTVITTVLADPKNTPFINFIKSIGLPEIAAPLVAKIMGKQFGQVRPATKEDLLLLTSSNIIGKVNKKSVNNLLTISKNLLSKEIASKFSLEGITFPLDNKWVLTPIEQKNIKMATDAYNIKINSIVNSNKNLALLDLKTILNKASTKGLSFDNYTMTTSLVFGGLFSLDGIHPTTRGYAYLANKFLEAIDANFNSNFAKATNGMAKASDYPTNYSPFLR